MNRVVHHGYEITVAATNERGVWRAQAIIIWDKEKIELDDEARFPSQLEAENHAVESGKHWVNNRIQSIQRDPES